MGWSVISNCVRVLASQGAATLMNFQGKRLVCYCIQSFNCCFHWAFCDLPNLRFHFCR